jgi:hypothetical protein
VIRERFERIVWCVFIECGRFGERSERIGWCVFGGCGWVRNGVDVFFFLCSLVFGRFGDRNIRFTSCVFSGCRRFVERIDRVCCGVLSAALPHSYTNI